MRTFLSVAALIACTSAAMAICPTPKGPAASTVGAKVGGHTITVADIDREMGERLCAAELEHAQKIAEMREEALDRMIDERLLAAEAKRRGVTDIGALMDQVTAKVPDPSDPEIAAVYEQNKDRMEGASLDDVKGEIRGYLLQQSRGAVAQKFVQTLREAAKVKTSLPPFRLKVPKGGSSIGPADAPITIVEFADFQCPYCARGLPAVAALKKRYPNKLRFVFRDFPLANHPRAVPAAIAARCAGKQGQFWAMHDRLFANMRALEDSDLAGYAAELKLDLKKFATCQADPSVAQGVGADHAAGLKLGVSGTPAFFINGIPLTGAQPVEAFVPIIERELAR